MGLRQRSFSYGELSPSMWARDDLDAYNGGLRRCRNFFATPQGALLNRSGSKPVGSWSALPRLVRFSISDTDSLLVVFLNNSINFVRNGALVVAPGDVIVSVATTYTTADIALLKCVQVGDVLTIVCPGHPPRELVRVTADNLTWTLTDIGFAVLLSWYTTGYEPAIIDLPDRTTTANNQADATHPAREHRWKVTTLFRDTITGEIWEGSPVDVSYSITLSGGEPYSYALPAPTSLALGEDRPVTIGWPGTAGLVSTPPAYTNLASFAMRVYRGRGELFGLVGETKTRYFVDVGEAPDFTIQPPQGRDPFRFDTGPSGATPRYERPTCAEFFRQRMFYGGMTERPRTVLGSELGNFTNFDKKYGPLSVFLASDPIEYELASARRDDIRSYRALHELFILTSGGVYTMNDISALSAPLFIKHTDDGATVLDPLVIGDSLFYVREKGQGVNEIDFSQQRGKYQVNPMTVFASHLLDAKEITRWAYARDPYEVVWAVRDDGKLLSFTYNRTFGALAWAWHDSGALDTATGDTAACSYRDVCTVPEGDEDAVYVIAERLVYPANPLLGPSTTYSLERFTTRRVSDDWEGGVDEAVFLDWFLTFDNTASPTNTITGLAHLMRYPNVYAVADGQVVGPLTVASDGSVNLGLASPPSVVHVGLVYWPELETLDYSPARADVRSLEKIVTKVFFDVVQSRGAWVGEALTGKLYEWRQRNVSTTPIPVYTGLVEVKVSSTWNKRGRAVLRQKDPLPLMVTGLEREVENGGR